MEELASIWYNVISLNQKTGKRYMTMTKPTFTDEFKQGVVIIQAMKLRKQPD